MFISPCLFLSSPVFPGIRFWHLCQHPDSYRDGGPVARVSGSLISPPFSIKTKHLQEDGIFDLWMQRYEGNWKMQKYYWNRVTGITAGSDSLAKVEAEGG